MPVTGDIAGYFPGFASYDFPVEKREYSWGENGVVTPSMLSTFLDSQST